MDTVSQPHTFGASLFMPSAFSPFDELGHLVSCNSYFQVSYCVYVSELRIIYCGLVQANLDSMKDALSGNCRKASLYRT